MIEVKDIRKTYKTGSFEQMALDGVSLAFRENEFVAVLGPSGSGKTTLLNILGGLDHADSGDIVINGISTRQYKSRDWDTYRNHRIGFIFQSYNLIQHQSVLSNVEMALMLAGVPRAERRERAIRELENVGLGEHVHKRPSQLSGGQMQRVAIARALVNDPDIVLADEPTGALDTETGLQVMDLLEHVADDRLVIMVTHNPELAATYATRIVKLSDGHIIEDSDPYVPDEPAPGQAAEADVALPAAGALAAEESAAADGAPTQELAPAADGAPEQELAPAADGAPEQELAPAAGALAAEESAAADDAPVQELAPMQVSPQENAAEGEAAKEPASKGRKRRSSMSFLTALSLSFSNLMTKKGRTFMTAFAGSIGIIGIAAILSLSNGVNNYIAKVEEETLSSYPLTITKTSYDLTALLGGNSASGNDGSDSGDSSVQAAGDTDIPEVTMVSDMFAEIKNNDLSSFRDYLKSGKSDIDSHVNTIEYSYGITPQIYAADTTNGVKKLNPGVLEQSMTMSETAAQLMTTSAFNEMIDDQEMLDEQYEVVAGHWPQSYDECVLVLMPNGSISDYTLYSMGVLDPDDLQDMVDAAMDAKEVDVPDTNVDFTYDDALATTFKVVEPCDCYQYNADQGVWTDMSDDTAFMKEKVGEGITLKVVGVVKAFETTTSPALTPGIGYTSALTASLMQRAAESDIVKQQLASPDVDVFTGKTFEQLQSDENNALDMSSFFTIDADAIKNAFSFDTSAIDTSSMDLDTSSLSGSFDAESFIANMPMPDFSNISMGSMDTIPKLTDEEVQQVSDASNALMVGFLSYLAKNGGITEGTDFSTLFQKYLAEDSAAQGYVQTISVIVGRATSTSMASQIQAAVESAMQDYMTNDFAPYMQSTMESMVQEMASAIAASMQSSISSLSDSMGSAISVDENAFANAIKFNMTEEDLTSLITNYANADKLTYDNNLSKLGYAEEDSPESISIYPLDFKNKEDVLSIIDGYNQEMKDAGDDDKAISYTDVMGSLISSVTDIVNTISEVLIAFVSISLVVSSIMIGIITYISVLERKKEIGILRAMGASKRNIASVFNAETVIEGLIAGVLAIAVVLIASIPVNAYILATKHIANIMSLPWQSALALIGISVFLTFIAGLIPSVNASRRDPVEALRSE